MKLLDKILILTILVIGVFTFFVMSGWIFIGMATLPPVPVYQYAPQLWIPGTNTSSPIAEPVNTVPAYQPQKVCYKFQLETVCEVK
jgi:hypothetical protein